jgi:hypothetical protein
MVEATHFERFVLPFTEELGQAIIDCIITYDLATDTVKLRMKHIRDKLMDAGIDTPPTAPILLSRSTAETETAPSLSRRGGSSPTTANSCSASPPPSPSSTLLP